MNDQYSDYLKKSLPYWDSLNDGQRRLLLANTSAVSYAKGRNVHGSGGKCTGAILLRSGLLRAYMMSDEGREITLYRINPGEICMLSASCVLKSITFDVFVDAEKDSEALLITPGALLQLSDENVYAENFALRIAVHRFSDVMWTMQQILFMSFDKRLAVFLVGELAKTEGDTIRLTHEQIAGYTGSAREVVSRMLEYFASEKLVKLSRGGVTVLDRRRLESMAVQHVKDGVL